MLVSVRIEKSGSISGQLGHDFDKRPEYADSEKKSENVTVFGGSVAEIKKRILNQSESVLKLHGDHVTSKRNAILEMELPSEKQVSELRKIRSWRKDAVTHKTMIVTFDNEFYLNRDRIDRDELDRCMIEFTDKFCKKNHCEISYIVRHEDETTPHYHVTFTNYNTQKNTTHKLKQVDLSATQDLAGASFSPIGINRGIKKADRLAMARQAFPQKNDESDRDYSRRIKRSSNVIHRSVAQMHIDLPEELSELRLEVENARIAESKNRALLEKAIKKLQEQQAEIEHNQPLLDKLIDRVNAYKRRVETHKQKELDALSNLAELQNKAQAINSEINQTSKELQCNQHKLSLVKGEINSKQNHLQNLNGSISKSEQTLQSNQLEVDNLNKFISKFVKTPLPTSISEEFTVKTGLVKHEKMYLIRPSKFQELIQHNKAHELKNSNENLRLKKLNETLCRKESELKKRISNFDSEVNSVVRDKIEQMKATLRPELINDMVSTMTQVAEEISRLDKKHNIHQGIRYGRSLTSEQESDLRSALETTIGSDYMRAVVQLKESKIEKLVDAKLGINMNYPNF